MKRYFDIINHFGVRAQMKKLNEECFEFLEAVDTYEDFSDGLYTHASPEDINFFRDHVIEEMGDMLLLLTQFSVLYKIDKDELDKWMDYKLERTEGYIKDMVSKGEHVR